MPAVVGSPVRSLAGFQSSPRGSVPPAFVDPLPLGVRLYSLVSAGDRWVTDWVDDIEFRSVVPGGFASATITLRVPQNMAALPHPDPLGFSRLTELFRRIQVVDLRSMEIAWEGRVEDPARQVEPDTWQIGALGSMVAASDVSRPVFYIDTSLDRWVATEDMTTSLSYWFQQNPPRWSTQKDDVSHTLTTSFGGDWPATSLHYSWRWDSHGFDQPIARISISMEGATNGGTSDPTQMLSLMGLGSGAPSDGITWSSGAVIQTKVLGSAITDTNQRVIGLGSQAVSGYTYVPSSDGEMSQKFRNPLIVAQRQDRYGNHLTTGYGHNYVTAALVVEDVLGRFLVGGWYELAANTPYPGSVRPTEAYIDASDTTQILHLVYDQGATAADILGDLMTQVQTNAYWAIWESKWRASTPNTAFGGDAGFRFEWVTWPNNWGYLATSQDGFEGQPNGDQVINFVSQRYQDTGDNNVWHVNTAFLGDSMAPELLEGGFTRSVTLNKTDPTDSSTASNLASAYITANSRVLNAGTLTVRRPIQLYDAGTTSNSGAGRMLDPWMIRPGKLIRIVDLPPRAATLDMSHGVTAPNPMLNGTVFKVVATTYTSADNTCRLELDQVARWAIPTQIKAGAPVLNPVRIQ